jgi:hypothetical protein
VKNYITLHNNVPVAVRDRLALAGRIAYKNHKFFWGINVAGKDSEARYGCHRC